MSTVSAHGRRGGALAAALGVSLFTVVAGPAAADQPQRVPNGVKYRDTGVQPARGRSGSASLTARALLGKDGVTELELSTGGLDTAAVAPGTLAKVQVKGFDAAGELRYVRNHNNLSQGGYLKYTYPDLLRGQPLQVQANIRGIDPRRTDVVTSQVKVALRPDLQVGSLSLAPRVKPNVPVNVAAVVREANLEVGARADAVLYVDGVAADRAEGVWVDAKGTVSVAFTPTFQSVGQHQVEIRIENVTPGDFDPSNNSVAASVEVVSPGQSFRGHWANAWDQDHTHQQYEGVSYRSSHENRDWEHRHSGSGWSSGSYIYAWNPKQVAFPITRIAATATSDGTLVHSLAADNLQVAWTDQYGDASTASEYLWQTGYHYDAAANAHLYVQSGFHRDAGGTFPHTWAQYHRYAGDVVYHSRGYDQRWHGDGTVHYSYAWNNSGHDIWGSRIPLGSEHGLKLTLTDGGTTYEAAASLVMQPYEHRNTQPLTYVEQPYYDGTYRHWYEWDNWYRGTSGWSYQENPE